MAKATLGTDVTQRVVALNTGGQIVKERTTLSQVRKAKTKLTTMPATRWSVVQVFEVRLCDVSEISEICWESESLSYCHNLQGPQM